MRTVARALGPAAIGGALISAAQAAWRAGQITTGLVLGLGAALFIAGAAGILAAGDRP